MSELISNWLNASPRVVDMAIGVALVVLGAWLLRKLVRRAITALERRGVMPAPLSGAARRFGSILIDTVAVLLILQIFGVSAKVLWAALTGFLAVAAVAFFAAWSVLSNIFCALLILTTRPFRTGDYIEVLENGDKPGLKGQVTEINLIYTTLTELEGATSSAMLQVPNNLFFQRIVRRMSAPPAKVPVSS